MSFQRTTCFPQLLRSVLPLKQHSHSEASMPMDSEGQHLRTLCALAVVYRLKKLDFKRHIREHSESKS